MKVVETRAAGGLNPSLDVYRGHESPETEKPTNAGL